MKKFKQIYQLLCIVSHIAGVVIFLRELEEP